MPCDVLPVSIGGWKRRLFWSIVVTSSGTIRTWGVLGLKQGRGVFSFSFLPCFPVDLRGWVGVCVCVCSFGAELYLGEFSSPDISLIGPSPLSVGFPGGSVGKDSTRDAGDPGSIPGSGRSPGEGISYPLQYSWASLVAQLVKNLPAMRETWVQSLGWEDPLEKGKATHCSILAWRIP